MFLQETHSSSNDEQKRRDNFGGNTFFSHGKRNSCGVLISYIGTHNFVVNNQKTDNDGRILILDVTINDLNFVLINLYNNNTETEQVYVLNNLSSFLEKFDVTLEKNLILAGDFNLFLNSKFDAKGGKPAIKKKSLAKLIQLKESYDLCDIWRIRNPATSTFTFRQKHSTGFIHGRLDYIFISNTLQKFVNDTRILTSLSTDHSPVHLSLFKEHKHTKGNGFWKFNSSLIKDHMYVSEIKHLVRSFLSYISSVNAQLKWEFLKYEIRKFTIDYTKRKAKERRKQRALLESELEKLENNFESSENLRKYESLKSDLELIYDHIAEGVRLRSKCDWYEQGEKSTKFFLNLEKQRGDQNRIRKLIVNEKEINNETEILNQIKLFYETLFQKPSLKYSTDDTNHFLNTLDIPKLSADQIILCDIELTEKDLYDSMKSMKNDKSPGNDGLTKEFHVTFWDDIKATFVSSLKQAKERKELSISQRQAIIKFIEKKDRDKRYIKNWRPISLLNVDIKILSKALAKRLKEVLPCLISAQQTTYVKNRNIGESGRLISDIIEIANTRKMEGFLVMMDVEKAFDSLDHTFLISVLKRFGFGQNFVSWIEIILKNQESCVINGGTTTKYFKLNRGARQGDPISAYLFILAFEILFLLIKENPHIKGLNISDHCYLYSAYADDTTFFLKDVNSIKEMVNSFHIFSSFSGLRPNLSKCEIAGIGVLKWVKVAVCGIQCVDLVLDTIKILGTHFAYNKKLKEERNFCLIIANIQRILILWKLRNLTLEGKILIFKTLALSKIIFQAFVTPIPIYVVTELEKSTKKFFMGKFNFKN